MANGPLGGFMPTPAAPAQPPQVKLDTTADSRSNFNNFLKSMNGAMSLNPPSIAPEMGAMTPNMAPALSNIDIFNQPISMMQDGGFVDDTVGDTSAGQFDDYDFGGSTDFSVTDSDLAGGTFDKGDSGVSFTDDTAGGVDIVTGGQPITTIDSGGTPSIPNVVFNNQAILNATKNLPEDNEAQRVFKKEIVNTLQDYAKDNDLAGALNQFQIEAADGDKRGENIVNSIIQASNVNPAAYSAAVFNQPSSGILSLTEKNITDLAKKPDSLTDTGLRGSLTPGASQDVIDTAKNAIRASAGNNLAIDNLVAQFGSLDPSIGQLAERTKSGIGQIGEIKPGDVEDLSGTPTITREFQGPIQARTIFDLDTTGTREFRIPGDEEGSGRSELDQAPSVSSLGFASSKIPGESTRTLFSDPSAPDLIKPNTSITTLPDGTTITEGPGFKKTEKVTRTSGQGTGEPPPIVAPGIGAPKEFREQFPGAGIKIGNVTIPTIFSLANQFSNLSRSRVLDSIAQKGYTPVYGGKNNDIIVGARDPNTGILMEGIDPNQQLGGDDGGGDPAPIIRPRTPKPEEEKPDLPPNVIGGTSGQLGGLQPIVADTVVTSPFASASSNIQPVTFDSGQLNRLIEMLTGVPARPVVSAKKGGLIGMANGGLIKAVDDFIAAS